jgi:hypothetical protein
MKKTDEFADFGSAFIDVKMTIIVLQASTNQDHKKGKTTIREMYKVTQPKL